MYGADQTTLYHTETGLAGTSWTYTTGNWTSDGSPPFMWFRLEAMRDGIASHQYYWFYVQRPPAGFDYGFDFNFDGGA